jgi:hypothetical protein
MVYFLACNEHFDGGYILAKGAAVATIAAGVILIGVFRKSRHETLIRSRMAKGECVRCGYPLGTHDRCTECGCAVPPRN